MAYKLVHGKDVIVAFGVLQEDGIQYFPYLCAKSCTFSRTTELIEKTHYASTAKEFAEGMYEWGITLDGILVVQENAEGDYRFHQFLLPPGEQLANIFYKDADNETVVIEGKVLVPNVSFTGDVADFSQSSIELKGTGPFTVSVSE